MDVNGSDFSNIKIEDYLHVPGVRPPEANTAPWKMQHLKEKNIKLIRDYLAQEAEKRKEEERYAGMPSWKKSLLKEKDKKRFEEEEAQKKAEEEARIEREKFEKLPQWKKDIMLKKKSINPLPETNANILLFDDLTDQIEIIESNQL